MYRYMAIFLGAVLIFYIAFSIRKYAREKIEYHTYVLDFITYVRQQITYFCTPAVKIIESYNDPVLKDSGFFEENGLSESRYLDRRGKKVLEEFFSKLGKSGSDEQVANCDYTIEELGNLLSQYKEDAETKYKAYSTLTVIAGLMLMILLI